MSTESKDGEGSSLWHTTSARLALILTQQLYVLPALWVLLFPLDPVTGRFFEHYVQTLRLHVIKGQVSET